MRINNVKAGEKLSPLLSQQAEKIAKFIIHRGNKLRAAGTARQSRFETRYTHICTLARHKYPYRGATPDFKD